MKGEWIKVEKETIDKRQIIVAADKLGVDPDKVFAAWFRFWSWLDGETCTGFIPEMSPCAGDRICGLSGFCQAMADQNEPWLIFDETGMTVRGWSDHNGRSAKLRAQEAKKKYKQRRNVPMTPGQNSDNDGNEAGNKNGQDSDKKGNPSIIELDKDIKEEKIYKKEISLYGAQIQEIEKIYAAYPLQTQKNEALRAITNIVTALVEEARFDSIDELLGFLMERVEAYRDAVRDWPERDQKYIPTCANWMSRGQYDDDPATWLRVSSEMAGNRARRAFSNVAKSDTF